MEIGYPEGGAGSRASPSDRWPVPAALSDPATWADGRLPDTGILDIGPEARRTAFAQLYRRHAASVRDAARMVLGPIHACDDVVAEVFLALWANPGDFDPERGSLIGFLRMAARARSIDMLRAESSRYRRELGATGPHTLRSPDGRPDGDVLWAETSREVHAAVASLPPAERIVIELAYFGEMTYRAVAHQLHLPEGTVKSRIRSGLRHLRVEITLLVEPPAPRSTSSPIGSLRDTGQELSRSTTLPDPILESSSRLGEPAV